ncbi:RsmB/NOP family class I SAM-dependent RNA methyltransferase [Candidatus Woesearchaeota archaeon]|nr:RsmB/NOP family class I SAM-dependent RNA methyltransferase [Candidatus Woesearchaeota archaeon]
MSLQHTLQPIPKTQDIVFKEKFIERYSAMCDFEEFRKYSLSFLRKSIRVNTLKMPVKTLVARLEHRWSLEQVPWCNEGFWIQDTSEEKRRDVGNLPEHVLGYIYIQEAASMIPPIVLDPKPGERVLDLCAAPGSKTTQLAQYMNNQGILLANDSDGLRLAALGINIQRCGITNCVITNMQGRRFREMEFDRILVDAPCSGTGTIRKSLKTITMWNSNMVKRLAGTQRQLLTTAFAMLRPGGALVYSTCTLEPEEDEGVVDALLKTRPNATTVPIDLCINSRRPVLSFEGKEFDPRVKNCLRIFPQDNDTEGFFVAKIHKESA